MTLEAIGASHKTASLETREKIAVPGEVLPAALHRIRRACGLGELAVLSTCNRVEFYFSGDPQAVLQYLADKAGLGAEQSCNVFYRYRGREAAGHLFAVAAGLDSMVLGESEVLCQCRAAYEAALGAGTTGVVLNAAFQQAFVAAKKVHSQTGISRGHTSIGSVSAALVKKTFGGLAGRSVLVIGAGTMAANALGNLMRLGPENIIVANRSVERGVELAERFGGRAVGLRGLAGLVASADVLVASAASPSYVLTAKALARSQKRRRGRPCLVLDIAMPRNVEPSAGKVEGVTLLNIDSLRGLADKDAARRTRELPKAQRIVEAEAGKLTKRLAQRAVVPVISQLRESARRLIESEIRSAERRLKSGAAPEDEVRKLAERLANKFLHGPVTALKEAAADGEPEALCEAARKLHGLGSDGQA